MGWKFFKKRCNKGSLVQKELKKTQKLQKVLRAAVNPHILGLIAEKDKLLREKDAELNRAKERIKFLQNQRSDKKQLSQEKDLGKKKGGVISWFSKALKSSQMEKEERYGENQNLLPQQEEEEQSERAIQSYAQLLKQNTNLEKENAQLLKRNTNLEKENAQLLKQNTNLEKKDAQLLKQNTNLEKEIAQLLKQNTNLAKENAQLLKQDTKTKKKSFKLLKQNTELEKENAHLLKQNTKPEKENSQLLKQDTKPEKENSQLLKQDTKPEKENAQLLKQDTKPEKENSQLLKQDTKPEKENSQERESHKIRKQEKKLGLKNNLEVQPSERKEKLDCQTQIFKEQLNTNLRKNRLLEAWKLV